MEIFIDLYHATVFPAKYKKSHFLITVVKLAVDIGYPPHIPAIFERCARLIPPPSSSLTATATTTPRSVYTII
jgi:hypothetical protein